MKQLWITLLAFVDTILILIALFFPPVWAPHQQPQTMWLCVFLVNALTFLVLGGTENGKVTRIMDWFAGRWMLTLTLTLCAVFLFLFHEGLFSNNKVLFSNDGSFGYMHSQVTMDGAYPGATMWNDLWWLGRDEGPAPFNISYALMSVFYHPQQTFIVLSWVCVFMASIWFLHRKFGH